MVRSALRHGSSNSTTHNNTNYPVIVAGGRKMGFNHGHFLKYDKDVPLSNLYNTIQQRMGVEVDAFADSAGTMDEV